MVVVQFGDTWKVAVVVQGRCRWWYRELVVQIGGGGMWCWYIVVLVNDGHGMW